MLNNSFQGSVRLPLEHIINYSFFYGFDEGVCCIRKVILNTETLLNTDKFPKHKFTSEYVLKA